MLYVYQQNIYTMMKIDFSYLWLDILKSNLITELDEEDPQFHRNICCLNACKFDELLSSVEDEIQKQNTIMRIAIPVRVKLEVKLRYLASEDSFGSLSYLFRVPVSITSEFLPDLFISQFLEQVLGNDSYNHRCK